MYTGPTGIPVGFFIMLIEPVNVSGSFDTRVAAKGFCEVCGREHSTVVGYATPYARRLFQTLNEKRRIDLSVPEEKADSRFSLDYLFGKARGQMFGVLVVRDMDGATGVLKAFSGQYNGAWNVPGWVPPLVNTDEVDAISFGVERVIKMLGRMIDELDASSATRTRLIEQRKAVSRALMKDIHALYKVPNIAGDLRPLQEVVAGDKGIPTGMGDCCAPKLLGYAAKHSLTPLGLAEFYVGKENRAGTRKHGGMYSACSEKCQRILGYMLCEECR
tara:strand:+ start:22122 stop:22943 length:822 start_codon:yes stop_codon:yes gene_type:complete